MSDWAIGVSALIAAAALLNEWGHDPWFWSIIVIFTALYWKEKRDEKE